MATTEVIVGRIARAHGVHGEVAVEPSTDEPERRFTPGAMLALQTPSGSAADGTGRPGALTVRSARRHQSRLLVGFDEVAGRDAAETLRGLTLVATVDEDEEPADAEEFYDHQLCGLRVFTTAGEPVGEITHIVHGPAQDLLVVRGEHEGEIMIPFVSELVPTIDLPGARVVVVDRPGLLAPDETHEPDAPDAPAEWARGGA